MTGNARGPSTKAYITFTTKHRAIDLYRSRKRCELVGVSTMRTAEIHHKRLGVIEALNSLPSRAEIVAAPLLGGLHHRRNRRDAPHEERCRAKGHLEV